MKTHHIISIVALVSVNATATAQVQQAGSAENTNSEETFRKLVEKCDDTDVLMLRARVRLDVNRTTPEAAAQATDLLQKGLTDCGNGDTASAKETLTKALAIAKEGADQKFGLQDKEPASAPAGNEAAKDEQVPAKPWWKFW